MLKPVAFQLQAQDLQIKTSLGFSNSEFREFGPGSRLDSFFQSFQSDSISALCFIALVLQPMALTALHELIVSYRGHDWRRSIAAIGLITQCISFPMPKKIKKKK